MGPAYAKRYGQAGSDALRIPATAYAQTLAAMPSKETSTRRQMKDTKSSLLLYIIYRYFFGFLFAIICLGTIKQFIDGSLTFDRVNLDVLKIDATLVTVLLVLQLFASRFVFRATINKKEIRLNGQAIKWENVKFISRIHHIYILKTKDKKRFYLFPTEKQSNLLFGQKIEYTDMDQIIYLKTTG